MKYSEVSLIQTVTDFTQMVKTAGQMNNSSLIEQTKPARVEPLVLVDETVRQVPWLTDVMNVLTNTIAGYYMRAVSLVGTVGNVGSVDVIKTLDRLNPSRSMLASLEGFDEVTSSEDSYKYSLPTPFETPMHTGVSVESEGGGNATVVKEDFNLAVGKEIEVTIESAGVKKRIPVNVRLITVVTSSISIINHLESMVTGKKLADRWEGVKSGRLRFVRDFILCQDLIDNYRTARMKDTNDAFGPIIARKNQNAVAAMLSGNVSLATASNVLVMSKSTVKALEAKTGLRLSDYRSREKYFKATYTMIFAVVDSQYETVTFYHRSIEAPTELSNTELRSAGKGGGPDITGILQAYKLGNSPSLL